MVAPQNQASVLRSPALTFLVVALAVFGSELLVMLLLQFLPQLSLLGEAAMDAALLVMFISPTLYFFLFQPMVKHIRERERIENTLRENEEEQFKIMVRTSLDGFWITDVRGRFLEVNDAYCRLIGYTREELLKMSVTDVEALETEEDTSRHIKKLLESGSDYFETLHRCKNGHILNIGASANFTANDDNFHGGRIYCFLRDITERNRADELLRDSESRLKELFENLSSGVAIYQASADGRDFIFTAFNKAAERIENMSREDLLGKSVAEVFPGVAEFGLLEVFRRVWKSGAAEHFPISFYHDGRIAGWRDNYVYKLPNGEIVAIYDDVTKSKQFEEKLYQLAHYDALSGLPNRMLFADRLQRSLVMAKRDKAKIALMFVDLDKFKPINDTFGHDIGDQLLKDVAKRMQNCLRESDTVSRMGGDEFVVLLSAVATEQDAIPVAEKVLYALSLPFEIYGHGIEISASIGVATYPEHGDDEKQLIKNADIAMYYAKSSGRNNVTLYRADMVSK